MATYDRLPVYRASYDFLVETFAFVKTFPREYKYTLGESIKKELLDLIRLYLRLTKDLKAIGLEKFVRLNEMVEWISKQLFHWENSVPRT